MIKKYIVGIVEAVVERVIVEHVKEFVSTAFALAFDPDRVLYDGGVWFTDKDAQRVARAVRLKTRSVIRGELNDYAKRIMRDSVAFINQEEFIDDIVDRIIRKQLPYRKA